MTDLKPFADAFLGIFHTKKLPQKPAIESLSLEDAWNDRTIPKIAQRIYDDRNFDDMPVLADALEEAGCTNADILGHCRGPGSHVKGCWVVDKFLSKE